MTKQFKVGDKVTFESKYDYGEGFKRVLGYITYVYPKRLEVIYKYSKSCDWDTCYVNKDKILSCSESTYSKRIDEVSKVLASFKAEEKKRKKK